MNDFTASNGITVCQQPAGGFYIGDTCRAENVYAQALREFFRAEEDARLGRWRVPGSPNWTCYPTENTYEVVVFNEDEPQYGSFRLDRGGDTWPYARAAAEAYFDAHPEPKPWHDAKPGEVWVIVTRNVGDERAVQVYGDEFYYNDGVAYPITYDAIESARRIWPEPAV